MKNSKFIVDKLGKLFEQGLISSKDFSSFVVTSLCIYLRSWLLVIGEELEGIVDTKWSTSSLYLLIIYVLF